MTGIDTVQSRLAEIRGLIDTWAGVAPTAGSASATSTAASSSSFASTLAALDPTTSTAGTTATGSVTGAGLVQAAKAYLGVPYVWGGESNAGMDCSGLVQRAMADLGVSVPRTSQQQATIGTAVPSMSQALPGDLLVFDGGSHIGIYAGGGMMVVAPHTGTDVQMQQVYATPTTIRRVLPAQSTTSGGVAATDPGLAAQLVTAASQRAALALMTGSTDTASSSTPDSSTTALDALVSAAGGTSATSVSSSQYSTPLSSLGVSA
ncbi:MAG: C40 family peptidase [Cellulomonas sp.]